LLAERIPLVLLWKREVGGRSERRLRRHLVLLTHLSHSVLWRLARRLWPIEIQASAFRRDGGALIPQRCLPPRFRG